jgi:hypothetical protein
VSWPCQRRRASRFTPPAFGENLLRVITFPQGCRPPRHVVPLSLTSGLTPVGCLMLTGPATPRRPHRQVMALQPVLRALLLLRVLVRTSLVRTSPTPAPKADEVPQPQSSQANRRYSPKKSKPTRENPSPSHRPRPERGREQSAQAFFSARLLYII